MDETALKIGDTVTIRTGTYNGVQGLIEGIVPDPSRREKAVIIVSVKDEPGVSIPLWSGQVTKVEPA